MQRDYKETIRNTLIGAIEKAGNAAALARILGASRQQVSLWSIKGKLRLENYLAILEYLDGKLPDRAHAVSDFVKGP